MKWYGSLKKLIGSNIANFLESYLSSATTPLDLAEPRYLVDRYVTHYNNYRLHSAIGYITPKDKLEGREANIFTMRKLKLQEARERKQASNRIVSNFASAHAPITLEA